MLELPKSPPTPSINHDTTTKTITTTRLLCSRSTTLSARRLLRCKFRLLFFSQFLLACQGVGRREIGQKEEDNNEQKFAIVKCKVRSRSRLAAMFGGTWWQKKGTDASSGHDSSSLTHLFMSQHWPLGRDHLSRRGGTSFQRRIVAQIAFTCG